MIGMSYTEDRSDNVSASATGTGGNKILSGNADNFKYLDYVNSASTTTKMHRKPSWYFNQSLLLWSSALYIRQPL